MNFKTIFTSLIIVTTTQLWAWGPGHDDQTTLIIKSLPDDIQSCISKEDIKQAIKGSHYPDSFKPFGDEEDANSKELLSNNSIKVRYDLHKIKGQAATFIILTDMFRQNNNAQIAFWTAVLGHSYGDAGAPNHHPLVHWYEYMHKFQLPNGKNSKEFSLGSLRKCLKTEIGQAALKEEMAKFEPKLIVSQGDKMAERVLVRVMDIAFENAEGMAKDSGLITQAWQDRVVAETPEQLLAAEKKAAEGWAKLIGKSAKQTINTVFTAQYLANNNISIAQKDLDNAFKIHKERFKEAVAKRSPANDSIYSGLLNTNHKDAKVAVVLEPTYEMNYGQLGFSSKYYAAAAMLALKQAKINYMPLDIRELSRNDIPSPKKVPLLIIASRSNPSSIDSIDSKAVSKALEKYEKDGGKIIQIGQSPIKALKTIKKYAVKVEKGSKLHNKIAGISGSLLSTKPILDQKKQSYKIATSPFTQAGWHHPRVKRFFTNLTEEISPCVELVYDNETYTIGVYEKTSKGVRNCFLPELSLVPYICEGQKAKDVSKASFDSIGTNFFVKVVNEMLRK